MSIDIGIAQNDQGPTITATLTDPTNTAYNLSTATVAFVFKPSLGNPSTVGSRSRPATIVNANGGQVSVKLAAADTAATGAFDARWIITFANGDRISVPNQSALAMQIFPDVSQ